MVNKNLEKALEKLECRGRTEAIHLDSSERSPANTGVKNSQIVIIIINIIIMMEYESDDDTNWNWCARNNP